MSMRLAQSTVVNLASIVAQKGSARLLCPGLGSCIAICALDPATDVGGVAHLMLPKAPDNVTEATAAKFIDSGFSAFLARLDDLGAKRESLVFSAVGGAQLFSFGVHNQSDLGLRNAEAVQQFASQNGLKLVTLDTGGTSGRSLVFTLDSGDVLVRTLAHGEKLVCNLRAQK
jgi:chemotaxis protein CheD